jgi:hypothetical protein
MKTTHYMSSFFLRRMNLCHLKFALSTSSLFKRGIVKNQAEREGLHVRIGILITV